MKKLMIFAAIVLALSVQVQAQAVPGSSGPTLMTNPNALPLDTVNNTTVEGPVIKITGRKATFSCVIKFTKISGTVAGTVQLAGSINGTDYALLGSSKTNTDVTSQVWTFVDLPKEYLYYKLVITPTGTMSASYSAWAYSTN